TRIRTNGSRMRRHMTLKAERISDTTAASSLATSIGTVPAVSAVDINLGRPLVYVNEPGGDYAIKIAKRRLGDGALTPFGNRPRPQDRCSLGQGQVGIVRIGTEIEAHVRPDQRLPAMPGFAPDPLTVHQPIIDDFQKRSTVSGNKSFK